MSAIASSDTCGGMGHRRDGSWKHHYCTLQRPRFIRSWKGSTENLSGMTFLFERGIIFLPKLDNDLLGNEKCRQEYITMIADYTSPPPQIPTLSTFREDHSQHAFVHARGFKKRCKMNIKKLESCKSWKTPNICSVVRTLLRRNNSKKNFFRQKK